MTIAAAEEAWPIQQVARRAGITSRTLRHYGAIGLLPASYVGPGNVRYYDAGALVRLQRILLLRDLGVPLSGIGQILSSQQDERAALRRHLRDLCEEQDRLAARIQAVSATLERLEEGVNPMADDMFDGFDHTQYQDEVTERWGEDAYAASDRWYRSLTAEQKEGFMAEAKAISEGFGAAKKAGLAAGSPEVQALAARHYAWVSAGWGGKRPTAEQYTGLGEMYVADPRFRQNYDKSAEGTADLVRDAIVAYASANL